MGIEKMCIQGRGRSFVMSVRCRGLKGCAGGFSSFCRRVPSGLLPPAEQAGSKYEKRMGICSWNRRRGGRAENRSADRIRGNRQTRNQDGKLEPIWQEKRIIKIWESGRLMGVALVRQETIGALEGGDLQCLYLQEILQGKSPHHTVSVDRDPAYGIHLKITDTAVCVKCLAFCSIGDAP